MLHLALAVNAMRNPAGIHGLVARLQTLRGLIDQPGAQPAETVAAAKAELAELREALTRMLSLCMSLITTL